MDTSHVHGGAVRAVAVPCLCTVTVLTLADPSPSRAVRCRPREKECHVSAWITLVVGCAFILQGVCILSGWRVVLRVFPYQNGWVTLALGGGVAADSLPRIAGWSDSLTLTFSMAGLALVILGAVIMWQDTAARRKRRSNRI